MNALKISNKEKLFKQCFLTSCFSIILAGYVLGRVQGRLPEDHPQRHRDSRARQHRPAGNQRCRFPLFVSLPVVGAAAAAPRPRLLFQASVHPSTPGLFNAARWLRCHLFQAWRLGGEEKKKDEEEMNLGAVRTFVFIRQSRRMLPCAREGFNWQFDERRQM